MGRWTKLAALFSIIASVVTIYDVGFRPKNAPSVWSSIAEQLGLAPPMAFVQQPLPMVAECGKAKPATNPPEPFVPVRVAPGREHKEIERLKAGAAVLVLQETAGWYLVQVNQGLNSSTTGWALTKQVDKVACGAAPIPPPAQKKV